MHKKSRNIEIIWYIGVFTFFYIWFTQIHPLVVFDGDDWTYIIGGRRALPEWRGWNPSRIFPEVVMPLVSTAAVFLLRPFGVAYLSSMTIGHAISVSACIVIYMFSFAQLTKRLFNQGRMETVCMSLLFLLLHFLVFRSKKNDNTYLFYCHDLTCYFYYLIPGLLNAALVMYMVDNTGFETFLKAGSPLTRGLFLLSIYFLIFSNLPVSGILAVYAGAKVLASLLDRIKTFSMKRYVRENALYLLILTAWLVSAVFELFGGRSEDLGSSNRALIPGIKAAFLAFGDVVLNCNKSFLAFCLLVVGAAFLLLFLAKEKNEIDYKFLRWVLFFAVCVCAMFVYLLIMSAKVGSSYMARTDCLFGLFFYGLFFVLLCFFYLITKKPKMMIFVPVMVCVLLSRIDNRGNTFIESNVRNIDPAICVQIGDDLVEQAMAAEKAGLLEMNLYVPVWKSDWENRGNWPHSLHIMPRLSTTLIEHGILHKPIVMHIVPTEEMNEKYGIRISE